MSDETGTPHAKAVHPLASAFRWGIGAGSVGLAGGGIILIAEGLFRTGAGVAAYLKNQGSGLTAPVMKATDEILFGIVLLIFASTILFGFCLDTARTARWSIPSFMRATTIGQLKSTFCQVIVVYLIVDFATDVISDADRLDQRFLYFPAAIVLIAGALRLLPHGADPAPDSGRDHGSA